MGQRVFQITLNGEVIGERFAWNSSIRFVEADVRARAICTMRLVETVSNRGYDGLHDNGVRVWSGNGLQLRYEIRRVR